MSTPEAASVRFGPLERRGVLLGLGHAQLIVATAALVTVLVGVYSAGARGLVLGAPIWVPLTVLATVRVRGRTLLAWLPVVTSWQLRSRTGATAMTTPPTAPATASLALPGIAGHLTVTTSPTLGAALVVDRRSGTATAIGRVHGSGFVLDDPSVQDHKVATWARVLSTTCQLPHVVRVQVLCRTVHAGAAAARAWWQRTAATSTSVPGRVIAELLDDLAATARRPEAYLAIALRIPHGAAHRLTPAAGERLEADLRSLADALRAADVSLDTWVDVTDLSGVLRSTYDPVGARHHDHPATSPAHDRSGAPRPALVGAMGAVEDWAHLRTDSAVHATYWVAQWPRSEVHPAFLQPLVLSPEVTRTVSVIAEPIGTAKALREIRRAKVEHAADASRRARTGQVEDEATRAEIAELTRRETELIAGHGDLRFTGLVTVTAPTPADLETGCAATEAAAAQALCEIRRLVGQQATAHAAAALPLARGVL